MNTDDSLAELRLQYPEKDELELIILAGLRAGLGGDTRQIAKELEVEHSLVIRACQNLALEEEALLQKIEGRSVRYNVCAPKKNRK
ncbi:hypothetical protein [Flexibacterium corallicola]|uniref:hypothetical protein n=1 Tax=Flexibacterium corallicola TaxID=3037259 RepID=UPI00286F872E|nr:hypothetical protein [Pseudovibrio sp. M1P-2-3]